MTFDEVDALSFEEQMKILVILSAEGKVMKQKSRT